MKICFHISTLGKGGAERVVINLAQTFIKYGHEVFIVTDYCAETEYDIAENIKRINLESSNPQSHILGKIYRHGKKTLALRRLLKREEPDVAISFLASSNFHLILAIYGLSIKTKTVFSVRNTPDYEYGVIVGLSTIARHLFMLADGGVFQTQEAKKWFPTKIQKKSTVIFNPVNDIFYQIDYKPQAGKIVTCGRLEKQKNHEMLIVSFSHVAKIYPEKKLYIYGEGALRNDLQRQIRALQMENNIFLMGAISDMAEALSQAEIFVMASNFEGMPNVLMEAMAIGVPCISTDCPCGGPRALLENEKNGKLVPVEDEQAMTQAIIDLLADEDRRITYSKNAKAFAGNFTQEKICQQWLAYIESLN